jgi:hypothetical protein
VDGAEDQLLSYAGAIIDTLRHERDLARIAHAHSREMLECRIHSLEAQLARRDAELEVCGEHVGYAAPEANALLRKEMQKEKRYKKEPVSMAEEEVMIMLQRTTARNKTLEEEIKGLFRRVCIIDRAGLFVISFHITFSSNKHALQAKFHCCPYHHLLSCLQSMLLPNSELKQSLFKLLTLNLIHLLHSPNHWRWTLMWSIHNHKTLFTMMS